MFNGAECVDVTDRQFAFVRKPRFEAASLFVNAHEIAAGTAVGVYMEDEENNFHFQEIFRKIYAK